MFMNCHSKTARGRYHKLERLAKALLGKDHPPKPPIEPPPQVPLGGVALPLGHWNAWTALEYAFYNIFT